jgi:hypothetical protein
MKMSSPLHIGSDGLFVKEPMDIIFPPDPANGDPPDQCNDRREDKPPEQVAAPELSKILLKKSEDEEDGEREKGQGSFGQNPESHKEASPKIVFSSVLLFLDTPVK